MADALQGKTEVQPTIETVVSTIIQEVLTAELMVVPTVMDFSSMVGPGMDTLKIPKFGKFTVASKVENVAVDAQVNAFTSDDLPLDQHKVIQFLLEDIADLQSKLNIADSMIVQAGRDLAEEMDQSLITQMEGSASAAAPDHIQDFANTPTDTLSKGDYLNARKLLSIQKVSLSDRFNVISPAREADVLAIAEFVRVDESGGSESLRNGKIGRLFGFDVLVSPLAGDDATLFYHRSTHAFARQLQPKIEKDRDLPNLSDRWSINHIYGRKGLDAGKRIVRIKDGGA